MEWKTPDFFLGLGGFFINLTANFHHNSVYLIICAIRFNHYPHHTHKKFFKHKYVQRGILRIKATILMMIIIKARTPDYSQSVPPEGAFTKRSFCLGKLPVSLQFHYWGTNRNQHASFPQKIPSNLCSCLPHICFTSLYLWYVMSYRVSSLCFCCETWGRFS